MQLQSRHHFHEKRTDADGCIDCEQMKAVLVSVGEGVRVKLLSN